MPRNQHSTLFRNNLKMLRAAIPISQLDLSLRIPMSVARYWRIENGYEVPDVAKQRSIARALGVEIRALGFNPVIAAQLQPEPAPNEPDPWADPPAAPAPAEPEHVDSDPVEQTEAPDPWRTE